MPSASSRVSPGNLQSSPPLSYSSYGGLDVEASISSISAASVVSTPTLPPSPPSSHHSLRLAQLTPTFPPQYAPHYAPMTPLSPLGSEVDPFSAAMLRQISEESKASPTDNNRLAQLRAAAAVQLSSESGAWRTQEVRSRPPRGAAAKQAARESAEVDASQLLSAYPRLQGVAFPLESAQECTGRCSCTGQPSPLERARRAAHDRQTSDCMRKAALAETMGPKERSRQYIERAGGSYSV